MTVGIFGIIKCLAVNLVTVTDQQNKVCLRAFLIVWLIVANFSSRAEAQKSPSKPEKPLNFTLDVTRAWIDSGAHIEGKTTLPDGDELEIIILTEEEGTLALGHAKVSGKQFRSGKFNTDVGSGQPL